jgi:hypothetical protein
MPARHAIIDEERAGRISLLHKMLEARIQDKGSDYLEACYSRAIQERN